MPKNALFAGSDGGGRTWATIAMLLTTAGLNDVDPFAWLKSRSNVSPLDGQTAISMRYCRGTSKSPDGAERTLTNNVRRAHFWIPQITKSVLLYVSWMPLALPLPWN